jgi:hypothetical protein
MGRAEKLGGGKKGECRCTAAAVQSVLLVPPIRRRPSEGPRRCPSGQAQANCHICPNPVVFVHRLTPQQARSCTCSIYRRDSLIVQHCIRGIRHTIPHVHLPSAWALETCNAPPNLRNRSVASAIQSGPPRHRSRQEADQLTDPGNPP